MTQAIAAGAQTIHTSCCIVGGGPAGMVLGYLLARAGVDIVVLEKHGDFLRDFRGDTIHPSTLEVMHELGILDEFLKRPHQETRNLTGYISGVPVPFADFTHLPTVCKFLAFMPQWEFLNFVAEQAKRYPGFHLRMNAEMTELLEERGEVVGVRAMAPEGALEIRAALTVGADGRHSTVRQRAGFVAEDLGAPIDVLWMRISRRSTDPDNSLGRFEQGRLLVLINRGDNWQCGYLIPKGGYDQVRARGLEYFQRDVARIAPFIADRVSELDDWEKIKLLTVKVDHLRRWCEPGLLCIGDSAHAMSPVGGVGINLAIQDAVATANLLYRPLLDGRVTVEDLEQVQRRREFPTRATQKMQVIVQDRILGRVLANADNPSEDKLKLPWILKLMQRWPALRGIPARLVGIGVRPEHIHCPDINGRALA